VHLQVLDCKHNEIASLPAEIGTLFSLTKLDLSFNMLTQLPWEMASLNQNLKTLDVSRNTLIIPPRPIVDKGTAAILEYLAINKDKVKAHGLTVVDKK